MATDPDSTEPNAEDPASLADARPNTDRGQGTISPTTAAAIAEAAAESVQLNDDGTGVTPRSESI